MLFIYFILSFLKLILAGVISDTSCPDVEAVQDFDMQKFCNGKWYQNARYPDDFEKNGDCVVQTFFYNNGNCEWRIEEVADGKLMTNSGNVTFDTPMSSGNLDFNSVLLKGDEIRHTFPIKIMFIDYDKFAFSYECRYNETTKTSHEYAWVYTKSPKVEGQARKELDEFLDSHKYIDTKKLQWSHFTDEYCTIN